MGDDSGYGLDSPRAVEPGMKEKKYEMIMIV